VVWTNKYIYIFEFEVGDTAQNAIQQIKDKKCIDRYMTDKENGKQIFLISVTCNEKTITNCLIEEI
jgi:hypothetical protein